MLKLFRPLFLLLAALTYSFGAGLADYLGSFDPVRFWLGFVMILLLQVAMNILPEAYRPFNEHVLQEETRADKFKLRNGALYISMSTLASIAALAYILYNTQRLPLSTFYFLVLALLLILLNAIPPFRLINRGFGEMIQAVQLGYLFPTLAFTVQTGATHPFLSITLPLTFLAFAYFIVLDFQSFAEDQKYERRTFLTRLGWERAVPLHHIFVSFAYVFFLTMPAVNLELALIAPGFLTLPFALYQIIQLRNIALGLKPNWTLLRATALSVFGLTAYFIAFTFWTR